MERMSEHVFESLDIRALADDELDDIVGGSIFEGKLGVVVVPIRPPGGLGVPGLG